VAFYARHCEINDDLRRGLYLTTPTELNAKPAQYLREGALSLGNVLYSSVNLRKFQIPNADGSGVLENKCQDSIHLMRGMQTYYLENTYTTIGLVKRFARPGTVVIDGCSGVATCAVAAALEGCTGVAIDNDLRQFPLAAAHVGDVNSRIMKEHRKETKSVSTRKLYEAGLAKRRFLYPLDTNRPGARVEREQQKREAAQRKMTDPKSQPADDSATWFRSAGSKDAVLAEDVQGMDQLLLEMALQESKHEEQQRKKVL
jgi:hypothetical protein